jgi:hypothetical protein
MGQILVIRVGETFRDLLGIWEVILASHSDTEMAAGAAKVSLAAP